MSQPVCVQVNWQRQIGGGEIYTRFFTRALRELGWQVRLIVDRRAKFWSRLGMAQSELITFDHSSEIAALIPQQTTVVVTQTVLPADMAQPIAARFALGGFVHMPMDGRRLQGLAHYKAIFPVSEYVRQTLLRQDYAQVLPFPMLGIADLPHHAPETGRPVRTSEFDWDRRKFRDRVLSWIEPLRFRGQLAFEKKPGITIGLVSRLTPIKQFPLMFKLLMPVLQRHPQVNIEVFGAGGYASVRDLKRVLLPLGERVRFWGFQPEPALIYPQLDFVMSGLPEREALGLNLIEAQVMGTPVLAVRAAPFDETVIDGVSGYFFTDPRIDGAQDFSRLLARLCAARDAESSLLRTESASEHLAQFSALAFRLRVQNAMQYLMR
jgi:glycosyltransferase involved in cell wall biosynthesis